MSPIVGVDVIATPETVGVVCASAGSDDRPARAKQQSWSSGRRRRRRPPRNLVRFSASRARGGGGGGDARVSRGRAAGGNRRHGRKPQPKSALSAQIHRKAPLAPPKGCAPYGRISECQQVFRSRAFGGLPAPPLRRTGRVGLPSLPAARTGRAANPFGDGLCSAPRHSPRPAEELGAWPANPTPPAPGTSILSPLFEWPPP